MIRRAVVSLMILAAQPAAAQSGFAVSDPDDVQTEDQAEEDAALSCAEIGAEIADLERAERWALSARATGGGGSPGSASGVLQRSRARKAQVQAVGAQKGCPGVRAPAQPPAGPEFATLPANPPSPVPALCEGHTRLSKADYRFLERFLDVTKAYLFFARAVLVVEGDAETILVPVVAKLLGRDFHRYGVSVVNVGGVGLARYARIFLRKAPEKDGIVDIAVACVTDLDVMPDEAPWIVGKLKEGEEVPPIKRGGRQWRIKANFLDGLQKRRDDRKAKASGQRAKTFVADEWTLEFDLAHAGLAHLVCEAASLTIEDENIWAGKTTKEAVTKEARASFKTLLDQGLALVILATHVYAKFEVEKASKTITARYFAGAREELVGPGKVTGDKLRERLPAYLWRLSRM